MAAHKKRKASFDLEDDLDSFIDGSHADYGVPHKVEKKKRRR